MGSFKDLANRDWDIRLSLVALRRLQETGVPLEAMVPLPGAQGIDSALQELCDLLHGSHFGVRAALAILAPAIKAVGLTEDQFVESVDDDAVMVSIGKALYEAIVDFFRRSPLRVALVNQVWRRGQAMMAKSAAAVERMGEQMDTISESELDAAIQQQAGKKSATDMLGH